MADNIRTITATAVPPEAVVTNSPISTGNVPSGSLEVSIPSIKQITTSSAPSTVAVVLTGFGEESVPDPKLFKFLNDKYKPVDTIYLRYTLTKTEQVVAQDVLLYRATYNRVFQEIPVTSDSYTINVRKNILDTAGTTETISIVAEKVLFSQFSSFDVPSLEYGKLSFDAVGFSEEIITSTIKQLDEISTATDTATNIVNFNRDFTSLVDATDDFLGEANIDDDQIATFNKVLVSWTAAVDTQVLLLTSPKEDLVLTTEETTLSVSTLVVDSMIAQDEASIESNKFLDEQSLVTDINTFSISKDYIELSTVLTDLFSFNLDTLLVSNLLSTDLVTTQASYIRDFTSLVNVTDDFLGEANIDDDQIAFMEKVVVSPVTNTDEVALSTSTVFTDATVNTESLSLEANKTLLTQVLHSDVFSFFIFSSRDFSDTVPISDSGFINNQSYFEGSYIEPGYVGSNTNFS